MKDGFWMIIKFFLFLLLLPLVAAAVFAFQFQVLAIPASKEQWFLWGVVVFILSYLFLYNFKEVHSFGQTIVSNLLKFFEPVVTIGGVIIPIYTVLLVCFYLIIHVLGLDAQYGRHFLLGLGFSIAMHLVLTAHQLYESDSSPLKAQYLLSFSMVLCVDLCLIALLLSCVTEFSFLDFFQSLSGHTAQYYKAIYRILFASPS